MLILGIETSCDETAAAVLAFNNSGRGKILSEKVYSQDDLHKDYGGVVPELASREHLSVLPVVVDSVLKESGTSLKQLSTVAVTQGPGLKGCLLMGLNFAKAVAAAQSAPLIGVNHIEGHALVPVLDNPEVCFPYLALIVSGGHTEIVKVKDYGRYILIARTADDAAGEAFDKSANLLGFSYPGGAALAELADTVTESEFVLPKVMREAEGFSFSGLKTAISLLVAENAKAMQDDSMLKARLAFAVQDAIIDALIYKLEKAVKETGIKRVCVSGGVSANRSLRARVSGMTDIKAFFPLPGHSTDNAAMIAFAAKHRFERGERLGLDAGVHSRWPLEDLSC